MFGDGSKPATLTLGSTSVTATGVLITSYVPATTGIG
jgi:hypothetical protein